MRCQTCMPQNFGLYNLGHCCCCPRQMDTVQTKAKSANDDFWMVIGDFNTVLKLLPAQSFLLSVPLTARATLERISSNACWRLGQCVRLSSQ